MMLSDHWVFTLTADPDEHVLDLKKDVYLVYSFTYSENRACTIIGFVICREMYDIYDSHTCYPHAISEDACYSSELYSDMIKGVHAFV